MLPFFNSHAKFGPQPGFYGCISCVTVSLRFQSNGNVASADLLTLLSLSVKAAKTWAKASGCQTKPFQESTFTATLHEDALVTNRRYRWVSQTPLLLFMHAPERQINPSASCHLWNVPSLPLTRPWLKWFLSNSHCKCTELRRKKEGRGRGDATEWWIMCEHFKRWETTP